MPVKSKFTTEQIEELRKSPFVVTATRTTVTFTSEFKKIFFEQIHHGDICPDQIFSQNGIDPSILGDTRIRGFAQRVEKQAAREAGFSDLRVKPDREHAVKQNDTKSSGDEEPTHVSVKEINKMKLQIAELQKSVRDLTKTCATLSAQSNLAKLSAETVKKRRGGQSM